MEGDSTFILNQKNDDGLCPNLFGTAALVLDENPVQSEESPLATEVRGATME